MKIKAVSIFTKSPAVAHRNIDEETIVIKAAQFPASSSEDRVVRYFNGSGTFIWKNIDGKNTVGDIINNIVSNFDVNRAVASRHANNFIEIILREGLIIPH